MTTIGWDVTADDLLRQSEDRILEAVIYEPGTTQADIDTDPAANREDIEEWDVVWELRAGDRGAVVLSKSSADGGIALLSLGRCQVEITSADTEALYPGIYWHTLARVGAGVNLQLGSAKFVLLPPIVEGA